uniref:Uncharacterized protein n=1 Tax=Cannabis sativa TaxID=3483 RepID=A0A803QTL9_CANSA
MCTCHAFCFFWLKFQKFFHCRLLIIVGVMLLVSSTRVLRLLPRRLRRAVQSGSDRSFGARQSGSTRGSRDPNPSTVIQAATLHHLIASSSAKEKA